MPDHKKNQISADDQKASSIAPETALTSAGETKKKIRKAPKVKKKKKNGLPIVLDVMIVILLFAVIAGAVFGIYSLGKYFSTRYAPKEITYTLLLDDVDPALALDDEDECVITPESTVYLAEEQGTYSLGEVLSVAFEQEEQGTIDVYVTVRTTANYNHTLGYFVEQTKIAVGKAYTCRFNGLMDTALIVELQVQE